MRHMVNVNTVIPHELKCRLFSALALRDRRFNAWLQEQAEVWLQAEKQEGNPEESWDQEVRHASR